jgi:hypothetical protein
LIDNRVIGEPTVTHIQHNKLCYEYKVDYFNKRSIKVDLLFWKNQIPRIPYQCVAIIIILCHTKSITIVDVFHIDLDEEPTHPEVTWLDGIDKGELTCKLIQQYSNIRI